MRRRSACALRSRLRPPTGLPSYAFPENAAIALSSAFRCSQWRERPKGHVVTLGRGAARSVRGVVERLLAGAPTPSWASAKDIREILSLAGVRLAPLEEVAPAADLAVQAAVRRGYPVVVKAIAPGLLHKSDVGGVALGLDDAAAVRAAVDAMRLKLRDAGHSLEGLLVQKQIDGGVEALVGVTLDPSLGPLLVAGLGVAESARGPPPRSRRDCGGRALAPRTAEALRMTRPRSPRSPRLSGRAESILPHGRSQCPRLASTRTRWSGRRT